MRKALLLGIVCLVCANAQTPKFPSEIATDADLKVRRNFVETKLRYSVNASQTDIQVHDAGEIEANMLLTIEREVVSVTSVSGSVLTVVRGFDGTTAAAHLAGRVVAHEPTAWDVNALAEEVKSIENTLGPGLSNVGSGAVTAAGYNFAAQTPGVTLPAGVLNSVTMSPCPAGVNGGNSGHSLYLSGGTGTAEAVAIAGGSCTSGAASGTVFFTPANAHSGSWTISSASGGLQEAVCAMSTAGGEVAISSDIALLANVGACGKTSVQVVKRSGAVLSGAYTILGKSSTGSSYTEVFSNSFLNYRLTNFGIGVSGNPNYPMHFEYGGAPNYLALDTPIMFARKHTADLASAGNSQQAMVIQHDAHYATGTPWAFSVFLSTKLQNSAGSAAGLFRLTKEAESTDTSFAVHGECFNYAVHGTCAAFNAEAKHLGDVSSDAFLIGFNSNVGTGGGHVGTGNAIAGFRATMNHLGVNSSGFAYGAYASTGTHQYGLRIQDDDGTFTIPLSIQSKLPAGSIFEMDNNASGTGTAPNIISLKRGGTEQARIESDIIGAGSFANGKLDFYTNESGTSNLKARIGATGGITIMPVVAADLSALENNTIFFCTDCTVPTCGGGGSAKSFGFKDDAGNLTCID